ncbi:hypothetical protein [Paraburkholderia ribeironis]|uniref:hypothetical protein n=1 Tax=Paraburkholderia ribeironis TaxID=1247936 RepID=UPI000B9D5471|nr:hypothetical protein [Paraburkholderia ribeironis]
MTTDAQVAATDRQRLNVRADLHEMRVAAVWQVLMPVARDIESVTITTDEQHKCADLTVSFSRAPREMVQTIAERLGTMSWVTGAALC